MFTFGLIPEVMYKLASPPAMDLIIPLLFYKDGFDIKELTKVEMPLSRETEL